MKVLKFGGKSLSNKNGILRILKIIKEESENEKLVIVVSARGDYTERIIALWEQSLRGDLDYKALNEEIEYQIHEIDVLCLKKEIKIIHEVLMKSLIAKSNDLKSKDLLLAQGELMASKYLNYRLKKIDLKSMHIDSRQFIITDSNFGNAEPILPISREKVIEVLIKDNSSNIMVLPGFIGSDNNGNTTTLGRNGSNLTASLLCKFLGLKNLINYTHVDGICSADPSYVKNPRPIDFLSYYELSELVNFGMNLFHKKSILPLINSEITLHVLNIFYPNRTGTKITDSSNFYGKTVISLIEKVSIFKVVLEKPVEIDALISLDEKLEKKNVKILFSKNSSRFVKTISLIIDSMNVENVIELIRDTKLITSFDIKNYYEEYLNLSLILVLRNHSNAHAADIIEKLKEGNISPVFDGVTSHDNMIFGIDKEYGKQAVQILHDCMFTN